MTKEVEKKMAVSFRCSESVRLKMIKEANRKTGNLSFWIEQAIREKLERDNGKT